MLIASWLCCVHLCTAGISTLVARLDSSGHNLVPSTFTVLIVAISLSLSFTILLGVRDIILK